MKLHTFEPRLFSALKNYSKDTFTADLTAGIIVGVVALPLSLAFAIAAGVSPEKGLITAIIFGFIVSLLGGSRTQIGGPTGAFVMIVAGVYVQYGLTGLIIASVMGGIIQIVLGMLKLGSIFKFIPYPIMLGLNTSIAISIFSSQIRDALGLTAGVDEFGEAIHLDLPLNILEKWITYFSNITTIDITTLSITICTIVIIKLVPRFFKKFPPYLFAVIVVTLVSYLLQEFLGVQGIKTIGELSGSIAMEEFDFPTMDTIVELASPAITIAAMGAIVSIVSCSVADGATGERHDSNTELIAEGIGNIVAPIFGGIPATGAVARTMVGIKNGGKTPIVGIVHSLVVLAILLFLGSLVKHIPTACLAGMLVVVSYNMCEWRSLRNFIHNPKSDLAVLLTTLLLTVIFNLTVAVEVSLIMAALLFMRRVIETTQVSVITEEIDLSKEGDFETAEESLQIPAGVEVYEINGPYFFGIANKFEEQMALLNDRPEVRVIRMRKVPFIDSTGIHNLTSLCMTSKSQKITIVLSGVNENVHNVLKKSGFYELIGKDNICNNINEALVRAQIIKNMKAIEK